MYVLLLKEGGKVRIGDKIRLEILDGMTGPLRIRFEAPAETPFLLENGLSVFPGECEQLTLLLPERGTVTVNRVIKIEVIEISPSRLRVGFDAPRTVPILLEEVSHLQSKGYRRFRWISKMADTFRLHR